MWDARNRLDEVKVETSSGAVVKDVDYVYDALNQKIGKIVKNGSGVIVGEEHYGVEARTASRSVPVAGMLSQATLDQVSVVTDGDGDVIERYFYGPAVDQVLAVESVGSQVLWLLSDQQGSVRTVISGSGNILKQVEYDGFGNVVSDSAPGIAVRFLYTGREWDADTQLQHNRARWFDPATGRWLSNDPMGFAAGDANLQRYVGNSGPNATDPSGLFLYVPSDEVQFWENLLGSNATFTSASNGYIRIDMKESGRNTAYHDSIVSALRGVRPAMSEQNIADILSTLYGGDISAPSEHDRAKVSGFFVFAEGKNLFVNMAEYLNAMETVRENGIDWLVGAQLKNGNALSVVSQFLRWSMSQRERAIKAETNDWASEAAKQFEHPKSVIKRLQPKGSPFDDVPNFGMMFPETGKHLDLFALAEQARQAREEQLLVDEAVLAELDSLALEKKATKSGNLYYVVDVINGQVVYNIYSVVNGRPTIVHTGIIPNPENIDPNYLAERNRRQHVGVLTIQKYVSNELTDNLNSNASDIAIAYGMLPFGSAWMSAAEGNGLDAALSGSADALMLMTGPFGFVIGASRGAKSVYALSAAVNASLGVYRGVQSYNAFDAGNNFQGSLFLGETFLRLLGAAGAARAYGKKTPQGVFNQGVRGNTPASEAAVERIRQGPWQPILDENGKIVGRTRQRLDVQWLDDEPAKLQKIYRQNNINAGVVGDSYQFWRDVRLVEALEERFHMVPQRMITRREIAAGRPGLGNEFPRYEIQVKEFMIRHQRLLGLSREDVAALQRMIDAFR